MLREEIKERIFAEIEIRKMSIGLQTTIVFSLQNVLEDLMEERPYATISELFDADE